jgi:2'-5' RNA ligase
MGEGAAACANAAVAVRNALTARGVAFDAKPFRPHVTLARVKADVDRRAARAIAAAAGRLQPPPLHFEVDAVVAFESVLSPKGPRYTPRAVALLGG